MYQHQVSTRVPARDPEKGRLERLGPMALHDCELLGEIIGKYDVAQIILHDHPKECLVDMTLEQLVKIEGITRTKAKVLITAFELARRGLHKGLGVKPVIANPGDILHYASKIKDEQREHFMVLYLNARNQINEEEIVSIGSLSQCVVHPREVFRKAVETGSASVVLIHNHPSGDVSPSQDDRNLTDRLVQAGEIVGVTVLDHIIVGSDDFLSFKERGWICATL